MRVILLKDIEPLGHEGDVVEVRDGYARNFLIPRGVAVKATDGALRDLDLRRSAIDKRRLQHRAAALAVAETVKDQPVLIEVMVGDRGRLHGRVTTTHLAHVLQEQLGITVDRRNIELREAIKAVGDYLISARLYTDVVVHVPVHVRPLGGEEVTAAEAPAEEQPEAPSPAVAEAEEQPEEVAAVPEDAAAD
jgi:large subunit ribosomal protein L9